MTVPSALPNNVMRPYVAHLITLTNSQAGRDH